jgi:hypothetical protein
VLNDILIEEEGIQKTLNEMINKNWYINLKTFFKFFITHDIVFICRIIKLKNYLAIIG